MILKLRKTLLVGRAFVLSELFRLKEHDYPYTEHDLMRFLFKLDNSIEVNIRPIIVNDEDPEIYYHRYLF